MQKIYRFFFNSRLEFLNQIYVKANNQNHHFLLNFDFNVSYAKDFTGFFLYLILSFSEYYIKNSLFVNDIKN